MNFFCLIKKVKNKTKLTNLVLAVMPTALEIVGPLTHAVHVDLLLQQPHMRSSFS